MIDHRRAVLTAAFAALSAVSASAGVTDRVADILEAVSSGDTGAAARGLDALFSGSKSAPKKGGVVRAADTGDNWGGSTGNPPQIPVLRPTPPRQDPPRQDPPRQDPPRQDPPRQDPPRLPPSVIPGTNRPA